MTQEEALMLQDKWKTSGGGKPCNHTLLELERTASESIAGSYFCVFCGSHVVKAKSG